jgi:hypothetical protein
LTFIINYDIIIIEKRKRKVLKMFKVLITLAIVIIAFCVTITLCHVAMGTIAYILGFEKTWRGAIKKAFTKF